MKLMGHSKYETTLRYAHVLEKSQHEAVEKLVETPWLENLTPEVVF